MGNALHPSGGQYPILLADESALVARNLAVPDVAWVAEVPSGMAGVVGVVVMLQRSDVPEFMRQGYVVQWGAVLSRQNDRVVDAKPQVASTIRIGDARSASVVGLVPEDVRDAADRERLDHHCRRLVGALRRGDDLVRVGLIATGSQKQYRSKDSTHAMSVARPRKLSILNGFPLDRSPV